MGCSGTGNVPGNAYLETIKIFWYKLMPTESRLGGYLSTSNCQEIERASYFYYMTGSHYTVYITFAVFYGFLIPSWVFYISVMGDFMVIKHLAVASSYQAL